MRRKTRFTTGSNSVFGEIFICQFPFTSGAFSKPRPVLVLFDATAERAPLKQHLKL